MFVHIFDCADALHYIQPSIFLFSWFQPVLIGELEMMFMKHYAPNPLLVKKG